MDEAIRKYGHEDKRTVKAAEKAEEAEKLTVMAGLDKGGYAWLRYGYLPEALELKGLYSYVTGQITSIEDRIPGAESLALRTLAGKFWEMPEATWLVADSKYGNEIFSGSAWDGYLDLREGSSQRTRLENYIGYKPKKG